MIPKSSNQITDTLLMIEPTQFGFNPEAALTNSFQHRPSQKESEILSAKALVEFSRFVQQLRDIGVRVIVMQDSLDTFTPDAIFPNNWISTHQSGQLFTYPMAVQNRRNERREDIVQRLLEEFNYTHIDLSSWEQEEPPRYLEGTGAMIFDRPHQICYAAISPRAHPDALSAFCDMIEYELISFEAFGKDGEPIYHTNVMLNVGDTFVCVGIDTIAEKDRKRVLSSFEKTGKTVIAFTRDQIYSDFAGNMLQIKNARGEKILVLSERIHQSLTTLQKEQLEDHNDHLLPVAIPTIERIGGGSVRCMLAELYPSN